MTHDVFVRKVAEKSGYTQGVVKDIAEGMSVVVFENLSKEEIRPFRGVVLRTVIHKPRLAHDPRNMQPIQVPARQVPKAFFSKALRDVIKNS